MRREVSLDETAELMLDEEVEARRILLQTGALTVKAAYSFSSPVLVELFSPPRLTDYAQRRALGQGLALDLTTCDDQGVAWDFNVKERKDSASELIENVSPDLLLGCPPCRMYSLLQYLNQYRIDPEEWDKAVTEAENHLEFCVEQYEAQMRRNKFFLHEHPAFATSWKSPSVERLKDKEGVFHVVGDMCEQDMRVSDEHGEGFAKKSTGYLTNSECIAQELSKRCSNDPDALSVFRQVNFSATKGQYPGQGGPSWERVQRRVTFDLQDLRDVHSATKETLEFRILSQCKQVETVFYHIKPGKVWHRHVPLLGGKAKQCEVYPNLLLRSILKGLKKSFGPTNEEVDLDIELAPSGLQLADDWISFVDEISGKPLSAAGVRKARAEEIDYAVRYGVWDTVPIAEAYQFDPKGPISSRWIDINKGDEDHPSYRSRLVIQEIRQSHIEAVFAATPPLESVRTLLSLQRSCTDLDSKGRRKKVLFVDIRRAHWTARIFRRVYVRLPVEAGNPEGTCGRLNKAMHGCRDAAACWELAITDFFTTNGFAPGIGSPVLFVKTTRDLKVSIHGDDITVLGFEDDLMWLYKQMGTRYEIILNELNLTTAKTVSSPGVSSSSPDEALLTGTDITRYRSLTMRANYLSLDRPDIAYATKELATRGMQTLTQGHYNGLKRLARYLGGHRRLVWRYAEQSEQSKLNMFSDSDDGESEFYAGIKAGSVLLGGIATMQDLGCEFSAELVFDATAAKAMLARRGHGKAKHIARCFLCLQQRIQDGDIVLGKCGTNVNPADLGTKHLDGARIAELLNLMGLTFEEGAHEMALKA
ncbi:Retrovirus-related Pol polyprotein from transposon RE2 (Retro element 2) (AtRE2) [Includes: Protease RE2 [Durusdinium trenchii]|uniref:Retrovirus-related Pol polyprotein from transposon RE2 (Retro element 2) (AtRE2) n=1 Tax=Durusdinium trenchii TaxID=1381693 RepID=A0ABP0MVQ8_9DINO